MVVIGEVPAAKDRCAISDPAALQAISCTNSLRLTGFIPGREPPSLKSSTILGREPWTAIELARRQRHVMSARQTLRTAFANIELMSTGGI
jgi:hypothetical protein